MSAETIVRAWPKDKPFPTDEQIAAAEQRFEAQAKRMYENGYGGDWGISLDFAMLTYMPMCWWHLFFPEEKFPGFEESKAMGFSFATHANVT